MKRILKEPLLHFVLIGAALFAIYAFVDPGDAARESDRKIVVTAGRIEQLGNIFAKTWQRPPTAGEMKGLIDDFVLEEVYYRKAIAMGIDQNDTMIRRRLRQKMEFLTEDAASLLEPSEEELAGYLEANQEKFQSEPRYTFRQLYFNPERHGEDPLAAIKAIADELRSGGEVAGDSTLLPEGFEDAISRAVDGTFGAGFAKNLDSLTPGEWSEPIRSGLGYHLVKLESRAPGKLPELQEVRAAVEREWAHGKRQEIRRLFNEKLLEDFDVTIERPKAESEE